ncbi:hypothetical protein ACHAXS_011372 [Conticribra weissflogii]
MAKKRKSTESNGKSAISKEPDEEQQSTNAHTGEEDTNLPPGAKFDDDDDDDDDDDSSSSDDDSLVLEGVVVRNPDASDSDSDDDEDEENISSEEEDDDEDEEQEPSKKKAKKPNPTTESSSTANKHSSQKPTHHAKNAKKPKKKKSTNEPEIIQVEFLFCDMNERFFHGMKTLLHRHSIHATHSSQLTDLILGNVSVGTVLSTDDPNDVKPPPTSSSSSSSSSSNKNLKSSTPLPPQEEPNVFGFATVINLTTHHSTPCIQSLKTLCLSKCPPQHKPEMETVLSGKTKRPAGFFFQERMVNVPLEITEVMHQQLVLDMDWAVENAEGGEEERKSLDFGAFVRLAPCSGSGGGGSSSSSGSGVIYKYFEDEVFATNAEFVYTFEAPKMFEGDEEEGICSVIVMTKTGHRAAMKDMAKMIHGK